jgi:penicillin-binding protein-related factor A (putative recombinase)
MILTLVSLPHVTVKGHQVSYVYSIREYQPFIFLTVFHIQKKALIIISENTMRLYSSLII